MGEKKIKIIRFPVIENDEGNLSFLQNPDHIPFIIERVYWIYDIPGGEHREGHAFKIQQEVIIALSGSFDVVLNNGKEERKYHMNRSYKGIFIPAGTWRSINNFATNSIALVISDQAFDTIDYIRNFSAFQEYIKDEYNSF